MMLRFWKKRKKGKGKGKRKAPVQTTEKQSTSGKPHYPSYRRKQPPSFAKRAKHVAWKLTLYGGVAGASFMGVLLLTLPDIDDLNAVKKSQSILVKSEDGEIIGSFGDIYGNHVPFVALPKSLVEAVIATEDRYFYHHFGIDPIGLTRAMVANFRAGKVVQGGSTVTQQVAKNVFLTPERSLMRKLREMLLAFKLEYRFSKEEIMSIYLNRVYLGAGSYGVDAAARRYFDKPAHEMTLGESAIIAGLLKAPSRFAPTSNPALSRARADQVLVNMEDAGYLTKKETEKARAELAQEMKGRQRNSQSTFYFADWIADQLPEYIGNVDEDLVVTTTLRPDMQLMGEKAINDVMDKDGERLKASQAAMVAMSPDGAVRVMIGGRSYAGSQFNRTVQSQRQPGSSFKLFVYLAGLEDGMTPDAVVKDEPMTIPIVGGSWTPRNYTGKYEGEMTMKEALTQSINTVAVQISERVGRDKVIGVARRLGIAADMQPVPSIALGATEVTLLEMTNAYAHMAAGGAIVYPYGILSITTKSGKEVYKRENARSGMVLGSGVVGMMNEMLMSVVQNGTGRGASIGRSAAGKTGTTSDYKDAWFIGYTPDLVAGVWVGNDDNTPMKKVTGGTLPAPIWRGFMRAALEKTPARDLPTGGSWLSRLPWQAEGVVNERPADTSTQTDAPPEEGDAEEHDMQPGEAVQQRQPAQDGRSVELGDSFWQKLESAR
jgi:penicillin-binding protein 1A